MATYSFYGYRPGAVIVQADGTYALSPSFDPATDRVMLTITDDDEFLDGDFDADEVGEDTNQTGVASLPDGTVIASGPMYVEEFTSIQGPDGAVLWLDRIEIGGEYLGYTASAPLEPGISYLPEGTFDVDDTAYGGDNRLLYSQASSVPCFLRGTPITTLNGEVPVEAIRPGMRLLTLDDGWQQVVWAGRRTVALPDLLVHPHMRPIRIAPEALGPVSPRIPLIVSAQHRVLISHPLCEVLFAEREVFVKAQDLLALPGVDMAPPLRDVTYHHILLARHQVIRSAGLWSESLLSSEVALAGFGDRARAAAQKALGARPADPRSARRCLRSWEAATLLCQHRAIIRWNSGHDTARSRCPDDRPVSPLKIRNSAPCPIGHGAEQEVRRPTVSNAGAEAREAQDQPPEAARLRAAG